MLDMTNFDIQNILAMRAKTLAKKMSDENLTIDDLMPMEKAKYQAAEIAVRLKDTRTSYGFSKARRANEQAYVYEMHGLILAEFQRRNDRNIISDEYSEVEFSTSKKTLPKTLRAIEALDRKSFKKIKSNNKAFAQFLFDAHAVTNSKQIVNKKKILKNMLNHAIVSMENEHQEYLASVKPKTDELRTRILNAHNERFRIGAENANSKFDLSDEKLAEALSVLQSLDENKMAMLKKDFQKYNEFCLNVYQDSQIVKLTGDALDKKLNMALNIQNQEAEVKLLSFCTNKSIAKIRQKPVLVLQQEQRVDLPVVSKKPTLFQKISQSVQGMKNIAVNGLSFAFNAMAIAPLAMMSFLPMEEAKGLENIEKAPVVLDEAPVLGNSVITADILPRLPLISATLAPRLQLPFSNVADPVVKENPVWFNQEVQSTKNGYTAEEIAKLEDALVKAKLQVALQEAKARVAAQSNSGLSPKP